MISTSKLRTIGCAYTDYASRLREAVGDTMERFERFCALPFETKLEFPYELHPDGKTVSGVGYELKMEEGDTLDRKEDFQIRGRMRDQLLARARTFEDPAVEAFILSALEIPTLIKPMLVEFAESLEREFGIAGYADDVRSEETDMLLRFLHYFGDCKPRDTLAAPHVDKAGFTLHLYESDNGVERLDFNNRWKPIPLSHDETIMFPALGLQQRTKGEAVALCHRVIATEETAQHGRFSAVCFVIPRGTPAYDKDRHGRLQDQKPGFNYFLSPGELDDLFKK